MTATAELDERIAKCQKILQADPNSQIFAALAEAYRKKGDLDTAFRICQNGLRVHPSYGSAHIVMAKINLDRGLYDWAEAEVEKARQLDGNSRAIELLLAEIYIYKGEFNRAIQLLKKLHESDPTNEHITRLLDIAERIPREQQAAMRASPPSAPAAKPAAVPPDRPEEPVQKPAVEADKRREEPAAEEQDGPLSAKEILNRAVTIPEVVGALFINSEGLVLEAEWGLDMDAATCGAVMADIDLFLTQELVKASFGQCATILIETDAQVFYMRRVAQGSFLFVASARVNLGTLRMRIGTLMARFDGA